MKYFTLAVLACFMTLFVGTKANATEITICLDICDNICINAHPNNWQLYDACFNSCLANCTSNGGGSIQ